MHELEALIYFQRAMRGNHNRLAVLQPRCLQRDVSKQIELLGRGKASIARAAQATVAAATDRPAAKLGMNLQSSTLKNSETGEAFHVDQAAQWYQTPLG